MVEWNPKEEMGFFAYTKFKLGNWVEVSTLPDWVQEANEGYYRGYREKYGQRPYDVEKVYRGDSLEYKIYYKAVRQGEIDIEYYARMKK